MANERVAVNSQKFVPASGARVPSIVQDVLRSQGQPLDAATRAYMEPRFGHNFSQLRVQPGSQPPRIVQPKLRLNQADDPYEREADQVSSEVMKSQKSPENSLGKSPLSVQGRVIGNAVGLQEAPPLVEEVLHSSGHPLDPGTREFFENRFGHQFGSVRVHSDARAAESAQTIDAMAYTVGRDVVFAPGRYAPSTQSGRQLLAHELTHVIQQGGIQGVPSVQPKLVQRSLDTYLKAMNQKPRDWYTAAKHLNGESKSMILQMLKNLGDPKLIAELHRAAVEGPGVGPCSNVAMLTEPDYLKVNPGEKPFDRTKCETPTETQKTKEEKKTDLSQREMSDIMRDEKYIDNHMKSISFYAAQLAIIHYDDGSELRVGLIPEYIKPPIEGVDYRTLRSEHVPILDDTKGKLEYLPRGKEAIMKAPDKMTMGELVPKLSRTITFKQDSASNRIVPTQINSLTAPRLCQVLRETEADYVKEFDAFAAGGKKVSEKAKLIVEIAGLVPAGGGAAQALEAKAAAKVAAEASEGLVPKLAKKLTDALAKGGVVREIAEEGVSLGSVQVTRSGPALAVRYAFIENVGRVAGQGRMMQIALEGAAIQAAKAAGAKEAQVIVQTVVNPKWAAYLESLGYTKTVIDKVGEAGFEAVWMKVLTF